MTTLEQFRAADNKVTEIENNGGIFMGEGYANVSVTSEYENALNESQKLYSELEANGIDPFVFN